MVDLPEILQQLDSSPEFHNLEPIQRDILNHTFYKQHVLVNMISNKAKTLSYQIFSTYIKGLIVIIHPAISYVSYKTLEQKGNIKTGYISSVSLPHQNNSILKAVEEKKLHILYVSPEKFIAPDIQKILQKSNVNHIVLDELQTINRSRESYIHIRELLAQNYPNVVISGYLNTLSPHILSSIEKHFSTIQFHRLQQKQPDPSVAIAIEKHFSYLSKYKRLLKILPAHRIIIIYVFTRKEAENLSNRLKKEKIPNVYYFHSILPPFKKQEIITHFHHLPHVILITTHGFTFCIERQDIDLIVHWQCPSSLDDYLEEIQTGQAQARAIFLYTKDDLRLTQSMLQKSLYDQGSPQKDLRKTLITFTQLKHLLKEKACRYQLLGFSQEKKGEKCLLCDNCTNPSPHYGFLNFWIKRL